MKVNVEWLQLSRTHSAANKIMKRTSSYCGGAECASRSVLSCARPHLRRAVFRNRSECLTLSAANALRMDVPRSLARDLSLRPTQRAPDARDSARFSSIFQHLSSFLVGRLRRPRPSAGNASRWAYKMKGTRSGKR
jgi:hypothetical protein